MDLDFITPNYFNYLLSHPYSSSPTFFPSIFFLVVARLFPIVSFVPFLGAKVMNRPAKAGLAIALFVMIFPFVFEQITMPVTFNVNLVFLLLKEVFIGFAIAIIVYVPFAMAQTAGLLIDHQRGASSFRVNDPLMQNMPSPTGVFLDLITIYLFFSLNGPFLFFDTVIESFQLIPPDQFLSHIAVRQEARFWEQALVLYNTIIVSGVKLAAPSMIIILMTDTFLGIANRLAPQVQMVFLGLPLKALFGIGILWLGWMTIVRYLAKFSIDWLEQVNLCVHNLAR